MGTVIHKHRMKISALLAALFALLVAATPAFSQTAAQSASEDRQHFVAIVHNLERTPLDTSLRSDRSWAIQWLTDAPDVSVTICADVLGGVPSNGYAHGAELLVQYMLGMGAFIVENPGKSDDADAQQLAGVESALTAYRAMRAAEPDAQSRAFEKLLAMQGRGELPGFVRKAYRECLAKGGR